MTCGNRTKVDRGGDADTVSRKYSINRSPVVCVAVVLLLLPLFGWLCLVSSMAKREKKASAKVVRGDRKKKARPRRQGRSKTGLVPVRVGVLLINLPRTQTPSGSRNVELPGIT